MSEQQQTRAIATRSTQLAFTIREEMSLTSVADVFVKSGLFKDVRDQAVAMVKILAGREMSMEPVEAMMSLYVVQGRVGVYAEALAAKVKADPNMRYKVLTHTDDECSIQFLERVDGVWEECGPPSTFTAEEAKRAGTQNMGKYPKNMLFARAMSNGFKWYCPHLKVAGMMTAEEIESLPPAAPERSTGARALDEALAIMEPPQNSGGGTLHRGESGDSAASAPEQAPVPAAPPQQTYRILCSAYKAHLGEEAYRAILGPFTEDGNGKSSAIPEDHWGLALEALQANAEGLALEGAPFPSARAFTEAQSMRKEEVLEGIEGLEAALLGDAWKTLRMQDAQRYLGDAWSEPSKALVAPLRVYHARLQDIAWQATLDQDDRGAPVVAEDLFEATK